MVDDCRLSKLVALMVKRQPAVKPFKINKVLTFWLHAASRHQHQRHHHCRCCFPIADCRLLSLVTRVSCHPSFVTCSCWQIIETFALTLTLIHALIPVSRFPFDRLLFPHISFAIFHLYALYKVLKVAGSNLLLYFSGMCVWVLIVSQFVYVLLRSTLNLFQ